MSFMNKRLDPRIKLEDLSERLKNNIDIINAVLDRAKSSFKSHNSTSIANYKQSVIVPYDDETSDDISDITDSLMSNSTENSVGESKN